MHELIGSVFDRLELFTLTSSGYLKTEIREVVFDSAPTTISKSALTISFFQKGKRTRIREFVGKQIISTSTDLPEISKLEDYDEPISRRFFQGSEMIIEQYLEKNDVEILVDGRKDETVFEEDNSALFKALRAGSNVENFESEKEIRNQEKLFEGAVNQTLVNSYERNPVARQKCIEEYGCECKVCGLNMEDKYGEIARGFIHVHHIKPLSEIDKRYEVNPKKDLIPLCPNCHSVIHLKNPPYDVDKLKERLIDKAE